MSRVMVMVATGVPFPSAVKSALDAEGMSVQQFSERYGLWSTVVSGMINGSLTSEAGSTREALAEVLKVERPWLDEQIARVRGAAEAAKD